MKLLERHIVKDIKKFMDTKDIVVLQGARQVGKTSIMKYLYNELIKRKKDVLYIDLKDLRFLELLNSGINNFINYLEENSFLRKSLLYLFIDEIQYLTSPQNFLKLIHDYYSDRIKVFVSGSIGFEIKSKTEESLSEKIINFEVYPLNFKEFLFFKGYKVDLQKDVSSGLTTGEFRKLYEEYVLYGGYPKVVLEKKVSKKELYLQQIIDTYIRKDIRDLANIKDILKFNKLLEILAGQSGQLLNVVELSNAARLARPTVENYLSIMEKTYVLKLLYPFSSNLRAELFKTPKVYFCDTGMATLLWLKVFPKTILENMFETSVFSEFIKNNKEEDLFFWRTQDKKEIDFIIKKDKKLLPIEVKLMQSNNYTPMRYFLDKYNTKKGKYISLDIEKREEKNVTFSYPWDI